MNTQTLYIIVGILIFICLFLLVVIYFIREHNAELVSIAEQTFENEQRLANKLHNLYEALSETNVELEMNNQDHRYMIRIRENNTILNNNKPEHLEY